MVDKDDVRRKFKCSPEYLQPVRFRKTTMDEIAQAARKGKSSIYYYFTSKEDIFRAIVEKETKMLRKQSAVLLLI